MAKKRSKKTARKVAKKTRRKVAKKSRKKSSKKSAAGMTCETVKICRKRGKIVSYKRV